MRGAVSGSGLAAEPGWVLAGGQEGSSGGQEREEDGLTVTSGEGGFLGMAWRGPAGRGWVGLDCGDPECHAKEFGFYPAGNEGFSAHLHSVLCTSMERPAFGWVASTVAIGLTCELNKWA